MCESSHQANMQIIIGLKWKRGKMFRNGGKAPCARPSTEAARALGPAAACRVFAMLLRKSVRAHSVAHSAL